MKEPQVRKFPVLFSHIRISSDGGDGNLNDFYESFQGPALGSVLKIMECSPTTISKQRPHESSHLNFRIQSHEMH